MSTQTANYQLASTDINTTILCSHATGINITVPADATDDLDDGFVVDLVQSGAGQITVVADTGVTINTPETLLSAKQWATISLIKVAADTWVLSGNIDPV